ncbi:hypothetical protein C1H46_041116 [Malus baccata]|uniref:Uncharacterized protein n=1 Tax=Malus baccata TaxID=106549 RepID=A0A540KGJ9_MALBA|nr:hypothetical protein C1H46_041116 [Malus baccata]
MNEGLNSKLDKSLSCQREYELEKELKELKGHAMDLKAHLMDKETELQSISEENETLRLEINKSQSKVNNEVKAEVEAARCAEREALVKLGIVMEEANKSSKKVARVVEHKNQTEFKVLAISDKYLLWTADKKNLDDLLKVGEGLFKKPVCRVNLETGRVEPCKHESNEEALTRFARLLSEEKWLRLARSPVGHAANPT